MSEIEPSILFFAGRFTVRGSCSYTLRLAERISQHGFRGMIACPDARQVEAERRKELQIREFAHLQLPIWSCVVARMMLHQLATDPPDLIHLQSRRVLSQGTWLARQFERPFVLTVHDYLSPRERLPIDLRWCRRIIAVSESVKTDLINRTGLPSSLFSVIHSGVDLDDAVDETNVLRPGQVPIIGTAGPLESVKGFPYFLGAAARVLSTGRDVEFIIAGAGPEESNLRRLAAELGIGSKVTFVSNLRDFGSALTAMDIFCLPSLQQGLGTIMLEAMALGRPVIATRVGGIDHVVRDNQTGLLIPPANSQALADRILQLLDDPAYAQKIGQAARAEVAEEFSVDQMVKKTVEVYRETIDEALHNSSDRVLVYRGSTHVG